MTCQSQLLGHLLSQLNPVDRNFSESKAVLNINTQHFEDSLSIKKMTVTVFITAGVFTIQIANLNPNFQELNPAC